MEKYSNKKIEFEYPDKLKFKKYADGGYSIYDEDLKLVINILFLNHYIEQGNEPDDILIKYDIPTCRRTVLGEIQYGDKKAFAQYFMNYRGDTFLGKSAQILFKQNVKVPFLVMIQSSDDYDIEGFRPMLESIKIKDVGAFSYEESVPLACDTDDSAAIQLPDEIKYLQPTINKLKKFNPDELTDDNQEAMDLVESALNPIIKDMSDDEAAGLIKRHIDILKEWIQQQDTPQAHAAYIQGVLLGMLAFKYGDYSAFTGEDEDN